MRGRLINKMICGLYRIDESSTTYDKYLQESVGNPVELSVVELPCQIEDPSWFNATFKPTGLEQDGQYTVILHYEDLEKHGLLNAEGNPVFTIGCRLGFIKDNVGNMVQSFETLKPDMYCIQARPSSFGLAAFGRPTRNLWIMLFGNRAKGV